MHPKNATQFRKWLARESERLRRLTDTELDGPDYDDAAATVREAGEIALRLHLPTAYDVAAKVRCGPLAINLARRLLSEILRAIPDQVTGDGPLTVATAAKRLGVSKEKLYALCREGVMPHERIGRRIVITPAQLEAYQQAKQPVALSYRHLS